MADYAISNVPRRVVYAASGVGPYAFTFEILAASDIAVYKASTLLTLTTDYTVTINANGTGSITLVVTAGTSNITIVGSKTIARTTDFTTGGDFFANTLNDELDAQTIFIQQVAETAERGLKAPVVDPTDIAMTLPSKDNRKGKVLAFDSTTGNPVAGPALDAVVTVIEQSDNINTVATNIASVNTVAGNISNVNTVAGVSGNVTAVATNIANVNAVGSDLLEATSEINTVAVDIANVNTVGNNIGNVNTVAGISANVTSVAGNSTNINTVAGNNANVTTVAGISSNVTTVAGISANVTTVAGINAAVSTVATNNANVSTVATNIAAVNTNATNIVAIQNASTNATNAATSATAAQTAQSAAESARDATLAAYDNFDDRYLGSKTSNPSLDNDGNALVAGALYFNSVSGAMQVYTGSAWVAAYVSGTGFLAVANNLSDVASTSSARTNLGLGTGDSPTFTGLVTGAGTVSAPAITTTGDTNTGIFFPAADTIAFTEGGVESMRIDSSGRVGINTTSLTYTLEVNGAGRFNNSGAGGGTVIFGNNLDGGLGSISAPFNSAVFTIANTTSNPIAFNTGGSERMRIDSSGNVGIGTSSPATKLEVGFSSAGTTIASSPLLTLKNTSFTNGAVTGLLSQNSVGGNTSGIDFINVNQVTDGSGASGSIGLWTNNSGTKGYRIYADNNGNIGIATNSPSFRLQLGNNSAVGTATPETLSLGGTFSSTAGANAKIRIWTEGTAVMGIGVSTDSIDYIGSLAQYSHNFYCGTSVRATINQYGIGVGGATASSGYGYRFPDSQVASSNPNTLDDYEEGTWTPNVGGTATYSTQVGTYTKIGDTVRATFHITVSTIGTGISTGLLGLPFTTDTTSVNFQSGSIGYYGGSVTAVYYMGCYTQVGSTELSFVGGTSLSGSVANVISVFGNSTQILGCVVYKAA